MRSFRPFLLLLILLFPLIALHAAQDVPRLEITGVNASQMPTVTVTANVYDNVGQPVRGLTAADFALTGDLVGLATITSVENITDNNLPFAVVLAIDISTSMDGNPLEAAKRAARAFIENLGPNDPVAIVTFATGVQVVQDYTTDKVALSAVIDSLQVAGQTALYQAAYDAVQQAASSPTPRRAVILLSDGAEYGGNSQVGRDAAVGEALVRGVPVYTIGLGFGADRTYLEQLSTSTNARTYESPGADELTQIYTDLAARLRSQYVLTLDVPLALDGTQYNLGLQVNTPQGSASATAVLRAPIPVPIVQLPELTEPLSETTEVTATVLADDPITGVTFAVNGGETQTFSQAPYTFTINPVDYAPDSYALTASATDDDGDTGSGAIPFTVAALPSQITLSPALSSLGAIAEPQTITVETSGQTATTDVTVDLGDGATELSERNTFTIDPILFPPGANSVAITVTNAGGVTSTEAVPFTVAALPPQVSVIGVQDGQSVGEPVSFSVSVTAQEAVTDISAKVGDTALPPDAGGTYTIDPMAFEPGAQTLIVTATAGGRIGSASVNVVVAALPPVIIVDGLSAGDVVSADRAVNFDFVSQTPVIHVAVFVDGVDLAHLVRAPFGVVLNVLDYAPGDHLMRVIADNASGGSSTLDILFSVAPEPAATATATTIFATQAAVSTATQAAVSTASAVEATQASQVTATQVARGSQTAAAELLAQQASATATAIQATQAAQATGTQIANASETFVARMATQAAQATATATTVQATQVALASATQAAQVSQTAIAQASATQIAQATQNAIDATATQTVLEATATQVALSTQNAALAATVTQLIREATATIGAAMTATQSAQQTATADQGTQVALNAAATQAAQSTQVAQAMLDAAATQNAAATLAAQATKLVSGATATQAALDATATLAAQATATQVVFITLDAQASATAAQQALLDATGDAKSTQQAIAQDTGTAVVSLSLSTQVALEQTSTQSAVGTQSALDASATQSALDVAVTETAQATQTAAQATQAAQATRSAGATSTQAAQATVRAAALAQAQAATRSALSTAAAEGRLSAQATQDARATRNVAATATQSANATATADASATQLAQATQDTLGLTATQVIHNATATQAAQETLDALATRTVLDATVTVEQVTQAALSTLSALEITATQRVIDATATRAVLETQTALDAAGTQAALDASATPAAEATNASQSTQVAQVAAATAQRSGQQTATSQVLADSATSTAAANATRRAEILATDAQATVSAGATETADALGTLETRQTAIGPTATPVAGGAQAVPSETPQPSPTLTEVQSQEPPASSDIAPILIVVIVVIVIILVLVLIMRGRGSPIGR